MAVNVQGLEANARNASITELSARLVDALAMAMALKQAHWNVKGPNFIAVHELFDAVHARLLGHIDTMAERIKVLDGMAHGTAEVVAKESSLEPYPLDLVAWDDHVRAVSERMRAYGGKLRAGIDVVEEAGDADTADLLTAASREADKDLWFIESHLDG